MAESGDFAVDFYLKMRQAVTGRVSRDVKRRQEAAKRSNSQPFEKGREPVTAGSSLDGMLKQFSWDAELSQAELFASWEKLVGQVNAQNSSPENLDKGLLVVRCKSTAWATQLRLMQVQILEKINVEFPSLKIESIKFVGPDAPTWKKGKFSVPGRGPRDTYGQK
jgi:predicted nucleic acid-binding Zn ribbon protein